MLRSHHRPAAVLGVAPRLVVDNSVLRLEEGLAVGGQRWRVAWDKR